MTQNEDAPTRTFDTIYTLMTWGGAVLLAVILVALVVTLFQNTPTGTARANALEVVRPTQTALAVAVGGGGAEEGGEAGPVVVDLPGTCATCHMISGTSAVSEICPDLTHVGSVAAERLKSADYLASDGSAETVEEYIRESILEPNAYCVDDKDTYCTPNGSMMQAAFGALLTPQELTELVTYLASLE